MSPFRTYRRAILSLSLLVALMFSQSARSAGTDPIPSAATVTVSVTLTGKDANGVPFSTVRSLDIPLAGELTVDYGSHSKRSFETAMRLSKRWTSR